MSPVKSANHQHNMRTTGQGMAFKKAHPGPKSGKNSHRGGESPLIMQDDDQLTELAGETTDLKQLEPSKIYTQPSQHHPDSNEDQALD